ncbi:MAG: outer membrane beta-barrel protein [Saprospiraceae bacterium]|nr:outer membrane beta-barrel protein [Saprospiraceae bacterium]
MKARISIQIFAFLYLSALVSLSLSAQSPHQIWAGLQGGYAISGTGDRDGFVAHLEMGKYWGKQFKAGLGLSFAGFDNGVYLPAADNKAAAVSLEANAYYLLFPRSIFQIEIGAGPHLQFWDWQYRTDQNTSIFISGEDILILPNQKVSFDQTQIGYNVSLGLILSLDTKWDIGVWGVHQNGNQGNNISSLRAGLSMRL